MPPPSPRAEVTPGKVKALQEALASDGEVIFRNGARVRRHKRGGVLVNRWPGRIAQLEKHFGPRELEAAYDYAMNGETEAEKAARPRSKPFWFKPRKLRRARPEWEECPF